MTAIRIAVLPGDGIGPEVTAEAERVLLTAAERFGLDLTLSSHPIGAVAVREEGDPLPLKTRQAVSSADAVLLGAVGDPSLDSAPRHLKPETGLLALRAQLGVYANLRPVAIHPALVERSPLKPDRLVGVDVLIVRELTGGLYYGEPRGLEEERAVNTLRYSKLEIDRVARVAFEAAMLRRKRVLSVDKANVLETSQLWRRTVTEAAWAYPEVVLEHAYVDFAAMRLVSDPASIDVLVTENLFGDILSDEAAVLTGSLGMLPSASIGDGPGLYEPIHGSAPDIAGQGIANPIGAILSVAMLLRYSGKTVETCRAAKAVEAAVYRALADGARTQDLARAGETVVGTGTMGSLVADLVGSSALV